MNQLDLFSKDANQKASAIEPFGCCAFYRECSDAGDCVNENPDAKSACSYYRNLSSGMIFYGKSAISFNKEVYYDICQKIDSLPDDVRQEFNSILIDFFEYNRGVLRSVVRSRWIDSLSGLDLFDFSTLDTDIPYVIENWSVKKAREWIQERSEYNALFLEASEARATERKPLLEALKAAKESASQSEISKLEQDRKKLNKEKPGEKTKVFLWDWITHNAPQFFRTATEPYRFIRFKVEFRQYAEEIYVDTLSSSQQSRINRLSPLAEDGFLLPAKFREEDLRRIRLSPGYSDEEKAELSRVC